MDEMKGDEEDGLDYVFLGDSGVVSLGEAAKSGEKKRVEEQMRDRQTIARLLKNSEMFRTRADIRNRLRRWFEKIPCLARFMEYPYMKQMSAQEVYEEHNAIVEKKVARASYAEPGYPSEALMILQDDGNLDKDNATLKREEYAKQAAYRFEWYIKHIGFNYAANHLKWTLVGIGDEALKNEVAGLARLKAGEVLSSLIKGKKANEAVEVFFRIGAVVELERRDLFETTDEELHNPVIKKAFLKALSGMVEVDAEMGVYRKVRDHMEKAGFFSKEEADTSDEVLAVAKKILARALEDHAIVFREVLNALEEAGLKRDVMAGYEMQRTVLVPRLVVMMRKSPQFYAAIRDRWVQWGILDVNEADASSRIETVFNDHLERCFERHPFFYSKMKYHWQKYGLVESGSVEAGHAMTANWVTKVESGEDKLADRILKDFEEEQSKAQRLIESEDGEENNCIRRHRLFYKAKRRAFEENYPQYSTRDPEDDGA